MRPVRAWRSCAPMTGTPSTSKPDTPATWSGTGRRGTRGPGMARRSGQATDNGCATFGHSAASLDNLVAPSEDERDNVPNVTPHVEFVGNVVYEYLPAHSRGSSNTGEPQPTARREFTPVDLVSGATKASEAALSADQAARQGETRWYRMVA